MNLRLFLTSSSVVLLSWMSLSYLRAVPEYRSGSGVSASQTSDSSILSVSHETAGLSVAR